MCYYSFDDFKTACCKSRSSVSAICDTLADARKDFNIQTEENLIGFICNKGLSEIIFINTTPFRKNPKMMVDAYSFRSLGKYGYIALTFSDVTKKWLIKSFKKHENSNLALKYAFEKLGISKGIKNE
jgi:hypothetical protein